MAFMKSLILATSSPYKIELMEKLGIPFEATSSSFEEISTQRLSVQDQALRFSEGKALDVLKRYPDATIIGADQIISLDERIFSKPGTRENAIDQLHALSGRVHQLTCAISVLDKTTSFSSSTVFEMEMRSLSSKEIEDYIDLDSPLKCCGSYKIESFGIGLFRRLEGKDYTAIIGLPLTEVRLLLEKIGYIA